MTYSIAFRAATPRIDRTNISCMVGSVYSYLPPAGLTSTGHDHSYHRLAAASALFSPIPLSNLPFPSSMQVVHSVEIGISSCFSLRDIVRWYDVTLPRSTLLTYAYTSSYDFVEHRWRGISDDTMTYRGFPR